MTTIQDIFLNFYDSFKKKYSISSIQLKVAHRILQCKTAILGGHTYICDCCGEKTIVYNSCKDRHCPMCQGYKKDIWIDKRLKDIVDSPYFHLVFSLPKELQAIVYQNKDLLYSQMYKSVATTLTVLSADKKFLGAQIGFISILHTWGQNLHFHPHIHSIVMAGGLNKKGAWVTTGKDFFLPVKVMSAKFRGNFLHHLKKFYEDGNLNFYGNLKHYKDKDEFNALVNKLYKECWYTFSQKTFSGPKAVIKYLGNYTHRIAISNYRIVSMDDKDVSFTVKDYRNDSKKEIFTLSGEEFIRRFLLHVLPRGFVKVRYYGILGTRNKNTKLSLCKKLTNTLPIKSRFENMTTFEAICIILGRDLSLCPICKEGRRVSFSQVASLAPT